MFGESETGIEASDSGAPLQKQLPEGNGGKLMNREIYRYNFTADVPLRDVEESLLLAVLATESLHGRSLVRLDASFCLQEKKRSCVVDAGTQVGRHIARIFTGFLTREFGEEAFKVERLGHDKEQDAGLQATGAA